MGGHAHTQVTCVATVHFRSPKKTQKNKNYSALLAIAVFLGRVNPNTAQRSGRCALTRNADELTTSGDTASEPWTRRPDLLSMGCQTPACLAGPRIVASAGSGSVMPDPMPAAWISFLSYNTLCCCDFHCTRRHHAQVTACHEYWCRSSIPLVILLSAGQDHSSAGQNNGTLTAEISI